MGLYKIARLIHGLSLKFFVLFDLQKACAEAKD